MRCETAGYGLLDTRKTPSATSHRNAEGAFHLFQPLRNIATVDTTRRASRSGGRSEALRITT